MDRTPSDLTGLSIDDLARLGEAHLDGLFGELDATWEHIRANCSPLQALRRHPVAAVAAAGAGLLLAHAIRGRRASRGSAPERQESVGRTFTHSLASALAGAAASAVPGILRRGFRQRGGPLDAQTRETGAGPRVSFLDRWLGGRPTETEFRIIVRPK